MSDDIRLIRFEADGIDDQLEAIGENMPIRRFCENLGIAYEPQLAKLKRADWTGVTMIVLPSPGGPQEQATIPWRDVPFWLTTIEPSKVKESARAKLAIYRREAKEVLARAFLPSLSQESVGRVEPTSQMDLLVQQISLLGQVANVTAEHDRKIADHDRKIGDLSSRVEKFELRKERAEATLKSLPGPTVETDKSQATLANQRIYNYHKMTGASIEQCWQRAYEELYYRGHIKVSARFEKDKKESAENHTKRKYRSKLDVVREAGPDIEALLYAITCELFPIEPKLNDVG